MTADALEKWRAMELTRCVLDDLDVVAAGEAGMAKRRRRGERDSLPALGTEPGVTLKELPLIAYSCS